MFRNYIKVALRSLWRFKAFSFINLISLSAGMTICLLVFVFVKYEQDYDSQYKKNIYRLGEIQKDKTGNQPEKIAQAMFPVAPALQSEIPGIKDFTRIAFWEKVPIQTPGKPPVMGTILGTDGSFLRMFGCKLLYGDTATALKEPHSIVLTQKLARNLFGNNNPIGQTVSYEWGNTLSYTVTGILPDVSAQSHLQFDALSSLNTVQQPGWNTDWNAAWSFTYIELDERTNANALQSKLPAFLQKHLSADAAARYQLFLQPLTDIHLHSTDIDGDLLNTQKFDINYIKLISAVAFFVLLLGIINYVNLSTARLLTRAKEVGVRKTSGASWKQIAFQFLSETILFSLIAYLFALLLVVLLLPLLARLTQKEFHLYTLLQAPGIIISGSMIIVTGLMAGLIPAIAIAQIDPVAVIKGKLWTSHRSPVRNVLVVAQFSIAIGLSMATLNTYRQLKFIQHYNLGFNKEAVIVVPVSYTDKQKEEGLMQRLGQVAGVQDVTGSEKRLGNSMLQREVVFQGNEKYTLHCSNMLVDFNYLSFYNIPLIAGRNLSAEYGEDRNGHSFIINETMARELRSYLSSRGTSLADLIGKGFRYGYQDSIGTIVGITRDFNFSSLHQRIDPLCISYLNFYYFTDLSIRLNAGRTNEVLSKIEQTWKDALPGQPFSWYFLDDSLQQLYKSDAQTGIFIGIFTFIAFFVSCLGLVGVAAFNIERRTKEIGIRKVLGATVNNIIFLLSKDFVRLVLVSIAVAVPAAMWAINHWMQDFAYHTNISWWMFAAAAATALLIAILTVSFQAIKAALANPVESIKVE